MGCGHQECIDYLPLTLNNQSNRQLSEKPFYEQVT
jgi:hypothetical protein